MDAAERLKVYNKMQAFAEQALQLRKVECGDLPQVTADTPCYVTDLKAARMQEILDSDGNLNGLTGWREDYGVTSKTFKWKGTRWVFGVVYVLASLEDYEGRPDIRKHAGLVNITVDLH